MDPLAKGATEKATAAGPLVRAALAAVAALAEAAVLIRSACRIPSMLLLLQVLLRAACSGIGVPAPGQRQG